MKRTAAIIGTLVFAVTVRSSTAAQFYDGAISRAQHLERELELPKFENDRHVGLFGSRKDQRPRRIFGVPAGHDLALSLVYATVLGGWVFAAVVSAPARKLRRRLSRSPESAAPTVG